MPARLAPFLVVAVTASIALAVLGSWIGWLDSGIPLTGSNPLMKANAAIGILLVDISVLLSHGSSRAWLRWASLTGLAVASLGVLTMLEFTPLALVNIDEILIDDPTGAWLPGRMGLNMATGLALVGIAVSWRSLVSAGVRQMPWLHDAALLLACMIGYLGLAGYANGTEFLYAQHASGTAMAPEAAFSLVFLCLALLSLPGPSTRTSRWLRRATIGGAMVRLMLPIAAIAPLAMGALVHQFEAGGGLDDSLAPILLVEIPAALLAAAVLAFSVRLDRIEQASMAELAAGRDGALAASRSKSTFLANMSHELRTPLNGMIGMTSLLADSELSDDQRERVQTILESSEALLELVNDVLDVSMIEGGHLRVEVEDVDPRHELERLTGLLTPAALLKGTDISTHVDEAVPTLIRADPTRLRQVVTNLLSNAVKFTDQGRVQVTVAVCARASIGPAIRISVADTGIGIPPDRLDDIFEPFIQADSSTTRRYGGSGLGLSISIRLAELMGGTIEVVSKLGSGSTFSLVLPLLVTDGDRATSDAHSDAFGAVRASPIRRGSVAIPVLIAEDNEVNQQVVTSMLHRLDVPYVLVGDGSEAVSRWSEGQFALVLMDCQMPVLDGYEATRRIRELEREAGLAHRTPIIAMTAHAMTGDRERCLDTGMDDYISKPFNLATFEALLARWYPAVEANTIESIPVAAAEPEDDGDWNEFIRALWLDTADTNEERIEVISSVIDQLRQGTVDENGVTSARAAAHDFAGTLANFGLPEAGLLARSLSPYLRRAAALNAREIEELAEIGRELTRQVRTSIAVARATPVR